MTHWKSAVVFASLWAVTGALACSPRASRHSTTPKPEAPPPTPLLVQSPSAQMAQQPLPAPSCAPAPGQPETAALHQLVSEYTEWKSAVEQPRADANDKGRWLQ